MPNDLFLGLIAFAFVSSITPGPNNLMLLASGTNFGFARSIPHMLGIGVGFTVMIILVGLGLIGVFETFPWTYSALTMISVVYLFYLAYKIATAGAPKSGANVGTPMTFIQAALFQWVNPKAWAMALTAISAYTTDNSLTSILTVAAIFGLINLPSVSIWTIMGQQIRRFLTNPKALKIFNFSMAALLIASTLPVVFQ